MNILKDRWMLSEVISLKEQEILHLHLKAAGLKIHPYIEDYRYKKRNDEATLCFPAEPRYSNNKIDIFTVPISTYDTSFTKIGYSELLHLLKQEIEKK